MRIARLASKFLAPGVARKFVPIDLGRIQCTAHQGLFYAALLEFLLDAARTVAARGAATNKGVGIAAVLLQAFVGQLVERGRNVILLESLVRELTFELAATVLAAGQRADRKVAR